MYDSIMRYKLRFMFISLTITFLIGCLSKASLHQPEDVETSIGLLAETLHIYNHTLDTKESIIPDSSSETHVGDALRNFAQTKRINNPSFPRYGLTFAKRKHHLYTFTQIPESNRRFPSGLMEAKQYLISLGRLII